MGNYIYYLNSDDDSGREFYAELRILTNEFLKSSKEHPSMLVSMEFRQFIRAHKIEKVRSLNEYFIEYLMFGILWKKYSGHSANLSSALHSISTGLYNLRKQSKTFKPLIDKVRGRITTSYLLKNNQTYELIPIYENIKRLVSWLDASKGFKEEVTRLDNWLLFLEDKSPIFVSRFISKAIELEKLFISLAKPTLRKYTEGVSSFLDKAKATYRNREDAVFCQRTEDEYYFNMVASEVLNREASDRFNAAKRKVVLLPYCMSNPDSNECQSTKVGTDNNCIGCSKTCKVNEIRKSMTNFDIEVQLVPHASGFSGWLKRWENNRHVGIVGVSCVLSLLSYQYEMASLNIPSQCLSLDHCGCQKHWPSVKCPTNADLPQILTILGIKRYNERNIPGISPSLNINHLVSSRSPILNKGESRTNHMQQVSGSAIPRKSIGNPKTSGLEFVD